MKVLLQGGLGNQMFQYAFARTLAHRGYEVALDAAWGYTKYSDLQPHLFSLQKAKINGGGGENTYS
ncbi:hypothetical protein OQH61_04475 [Helicobacter sp. MIT 21-1697]|uniref:hypothetical protein n=1 Tax=Helicobacter sp. MIT 21-1697 TaxID=2993733 RepID=UPI00224B536E|nr:hypothetical protein [Helicobacter sp. MIT 21-1697]MCX2716988.1 hypothetical protein [Helicobacter sp. MIT 21-1697]